MYTIGYEVGSAKVKAAIIRIDTHQVIATGESPNSDMEILSKQKGWAEQHPDVWWKNFCKCTKQILRVADINAKDIISIGIAYQMHGLVLIDKKGQPLRSSIIWCDSRAVHTGEDAFYDIGVQFCLNNFLNSPGNFTASKLKWIKDNEPDIYDKIYKVLLPGDYMALRLTGEIGTTISGLSEGILWNFKERRIATEIIDYYGFEASMFPEIGKTFGTIGVVNKDGAAQSGLLQGTPLTYRAGDQPNNALSLNVLKKGDIAITSSNSGVVYGVVEHLLADTQSRINSFAHINYDEDYRKIGILMCLNGAGSHYSWIKKNITRIDRDYSDMERMLNSIPIGSDGVCVLPYGNGAERIFNNKNIDAHIYNVQFNKHSRAHLYRASVEGIAFSFVYGLRMLMDMGLDVSKVRVGTNDMFQSKTFSKTIATLLDREIEMLNTSGAIGAALASGVGVGVYATIEEAVSTISTSTIYRPSLDFAKCSRAYEYWLNMLNKSIYVSQSKVDVHQMDSKLIELNRQLEQKNRLIENISADLKEREELKEKLISMADKSLKNKESDELKSTMQKMTRLLKKSNNIRTDTLDTHLEILNDPFILTFKEKYPQLSFEELQMTYFIRLHLSTKEIANRMSLSIRGVETKRYRLRKKLGLERSVNLTAYVNGHH